MSVQTAEIITQDYERVHGRYERAELYSHEFVKLFQVRKERNTVADELKSDIFSQGLLNPVDVARASREMLIEYLHFVETTWGQAASIEEFDSQRQDDGCYFLLIAGHSRHQAIEELEQEHIETGMFPVMPIEAKIHRVENVWDIIRIQVGENIHSTPPKERRAIALVEAYEYGKHIGLWKDEEAFLASPESGDATMNALQEAIGFSRLPVDLRNMALDKTIPYAAGVEMGKSVDSLRNYLRVKHPEETPTAEIDSMINIELTILAANVLEKKMNSTASERYITGQRIHWRKLAKAIVKPPKDTLELVMLATPDETLRNARRRLGEKLSQLSRVPGSRVAALIAESGWLVGEGETERLLEDLRQSNERAQRAVGSNGLRHAGHVSPDDATMF